MQSDNLFTNLKSADYFSIFPTLANFLLEQTEKILAIELLTAETAGINPEQFSDDVFFSRKRNLRIVILLLLLLIGGGLRMVNLGAES